MKMHHRRYQKTSSPPIFKVSGDANLSVGHIDFEGHVLIKGWVKDGIIVKASKDIRIQGGVEGSEIYAGGTVMIGNGVQAHNKGAIFAGGDIIANYINSGKVHSRQSVVVQESILHSEVFALDRISAIGRKGLIAGGLLRAGNKVEANTIGSHLASPTKIELGIVPDIREELLDIQALLKSYKKDLRHVQKTIDLKEAGMDGTGTPQSLQENQKQLYQLYMTLCSLLEKLAVLTEREKHLTNTVFAGENPELSVTDSLLPGVKVTIRNAEMLFTDEIEHVSVRENKGKIVIGPYNDTAPY